MIYLIIESEKKKRLAIVIVGINILSKVPMLGMCDVLFWQARKKMVYTYCITRIAGREK
jgi:hypothetical protein